MAERMVENAIIRSIISYVSRTYKAYRRGADPRVSKTVYPIPDDIKIFLKEIVVTCKDEQVFGELDALVQHPDRVKMFEISHKKTFQEFKKGFTPRKFLKWFAVSVVLGAELEERGFSRALDVVERDIHAAYMIYRKHEVFKIMGFRAT